MSKRLRVGQCMASFIGNILVLLGGIIVVIIVIIMWVVERLDNVGNWLWRKGNE